MKFLDPNDPFFARPWRRWVTVLVPLAWAAVELWLQEPLWALMFGALGAYAGWILMIKGPDRGDPDQG